MIESVNGFKILFRSGEKGTVRDLSRAVKWSAVFPFAFNVRQTRATELLHFHYPHGLAQLLSVVSVKGPGHPRFFPPWLRAGCCTRCARLHTVCAPLQVPYVQQVAKTAREDSSAKCKERQIL